MIFKFSENCPKTYRELPKELITCEFYQKRFPEIHNFAKSSENLETILVDMRFQFCLAVESIGQDAAMCTIKIFRGGRGGGWGGGSSERCLKWGGGEWGVIKGSFQNILKQGG